MNRFVEMYHDVREDQITRKILLAQSEDFYRSYFGYVPDPIQKLFLVEQTIQKTAAPRVFVNDTYRVKVRKSPPIVHLDISRHDGQAVTHWREFQQIKNQLVGPECEGVQLFPSESRLVDTAHQYHLWVVEDPAYRFSVGYDKRIVFDEAIRYNAQTVGGEPRTVTPIRGGTFDVPFPA